LILMYYIFFFQAEDGIRDFHVTGVQTCALPIYKQRGIQRWHEDGFAPALIAASCLEPVMVQGITRDEFLQIVARSGTRADHLREIGRASCRERVKDGVRGVT